MQLNGVRVWQMHNVNALHRRCRRLYTTVSVLHTQLLAHPEPFAEHTRVCGGYTRPFAEATRSSSRGLTLDYVNGIQARKSHKSVNCMQLNGIRVGLIHNVNAQAAIHAFAWATYSRLGATRTKSPKQLSKKLKNTSLISNKLISTKLPIRLPSTHN